MNAGMMRAATALLLLAQLAGCGVFGGDKKSKTPVLGERVPILTAEIGAEVDPTMADTPVTVSPPEPNMSWSQPGGNAAKSMGHPALGMNLVRAWSAGIRGNSKKARLAAAPVVADGRLYVIDTEATVRAFQVSNGRLIWTSRLGVKSENSAALFGGGVSFDNGRLYATTGIGDVVALEAASGAEIWRKRPGGPLRGAPTLANENVYAVSQDNQIFALKAADGELVWSEAATLEAAGVFGAAAPAAAAGTVVAGFSSGELTAFRYENGRAVWQDALSRTSISTAVASLSDIDAEPVIDQGRVYAIGQGGRMIATELVTGQRLWELNIAGISTPWVAGEWLFVVTDDARLLCVSRTSGRVRWMTQLRRWRDEEDKKGPISWVGPILAGGRLILASSRGQLVNVGVADGAIGATTRVAEAVHLAPIVAENTLFVLASDGRITAWR